MKNRRTGLFKLLIIAAAVIALLAAAAGTASLTAFAAENGETAEAGENGNAAEKENGLSAKAYAACAAVGIACAAGAVGMAIVIAKSAESMARQPEASGKINSAMMLGLVFIETTCIYALIAAILVIFVL